MLKTALISKILNRQKTQNRILTVSNWHPLEDKDLYQEQDQRCWQPLGEEDVEQEEEVHNCLKTKDEKTRRIGFWQLLDNLTIAWGPRLLNKETIKIGFWQQPDNFDNVDNCVKTKNDENPSRIGFCQPLENVDNWLAMKPCKDCPAGKGGWSRTIPIWTRLINLIISRRRPTKKHSHKIRQNPAVYKVLFGAVS